MGYLWYDLHDLKCGQVVKIEVTTAVNVKLMSYDSFTLYRSGLPYRYRGGFTTKTPCYIRVPYDAPWILVVDLHYPGLFQVKKVSVGNDSDFQDDITRGSQSETHVDKIVNTDEIKTDKREDNRMNYNALIIGVNEYTNKCFKDLSAVSNDVAAMLQILNNSPCQYQISCLTGKNATNAKITKALSHFFNSDEDDVLFLFWAGHGTTSHFIACDTDPSNMEETAIGLQNLADTIEQSQSRAVVVVLDCCHAGAIARGTSHFELNIQGDGKVIMASSDYMQNSYESPGIGHGHFTYCFLEGLRGGAASDLGLVTVTGLHDYICEEISKLSNSKQTPVLKATLAGQFILNKIEPQQVVKTSDMQKTLIMPKADRNSDNMLSHEEQIVIKALSLDDIAEVHVNTIRTLSDGGMNIGIRGSIDKVSIDFNLSQTKREFTKWVEVVDGLVRKGLLDSKRFGSGKCYSLSHNGYTLADSIDDEVLNNVPSMIDSDVEVLSENEKTMIKAVSVCADGRIVCATDIISVSERIETIDGQYVFANGQDARQSTLWNEVISSLVQHENLISLMGGKGQRYFRITNKGYAVASRIKQDILNVFNNKD